MSGNMHEWLIRTKRRVANKFGGSRIALPKPKRPLRRKSTEAALRAMEVLERVAVPSSLPELPSMPGSKFWIENNKPIDLHQGKKFSITIHRKDDPAPDGYVRIWLLEEHHETSESTVTGSPVWLGLLGGYKCRRWNGRRSITFNDLYLVRCGMYRLELEIVESEDGRLDEEGVESLYSAIIYKEMGFSMDEVIMEEESGLDENYWDREPSLGTTSCY
ncbi:hypothetical protein F5Y04DRAFT_278018 [Hypomontagnella monticulosa]|nr:hypothetical protein F5Y04DRAFT_278018 [Hypomontagnella monticulosa]